MVSNIFRIIRVHLKNILNVSIFFSILVGYRLLLHLEKYQWNKPQDFFRFVNTNYGFLLQPTSKFSFASCKAFAPVLAFHYKYEIDIQHSFHLLQK
jgi:hypothetical protein